MLSGSVTSVTYDLRGQPTQVAYANGASETTVYNPLRGWVTVIDGYEAGAAKLFHNGYVRSATGRILQSDTSFTIGSTTYDKESAFSYAYYDGGRLRSATNMQGVTAYSQSFAYDGAGRMRTNSRVGTYAYANATVARQAPSSVTPSGQAAQALVYDLNGNMLTGLGGKVMTYDGENRPLSVTFLGKKTCYVYGADGARLKKVENYAPAANCSTAPTASQPVTLYLGEAEIRMYGQGNAEQILQYPLPGIRIQKTKNGAGTVVTAVSTLHRDALGSVRAVTAAAGAKAKRSIYRPYGEEAASTFDLATLPETKGFIGERYDADAGLQYLNARYYDPKLGLFLQPDWWEVMQAGVGTNRYGYSGGDPVNGRDASGHWMSPDGNYVDTGDADQYPGFAFDPTDHYAVVGAMAGGFVGVAVAGPALAGSALGAAGAKTVAGQWKTAIEHMPSRAEAYQISQGGRAGQAFLVNGVKFDAVKAGTLIEAKGPGYSNFVKDGRFVEWFEGKNGLLEQAERQLKAARVSGAKVEWHFAEQSAAEAMGQLLKDNGITGIRTTYVGEKATSSASGRGFGGLLHDIGRALGIIK